jgi:hypothetical protein
MSPSSQTNAVPSRTAAALSSLEALGLAPALHSRWRFLLALATAVAAGAHVPVIGEHLREAPYMGMLFIGLTVACGAVAITAPVWDPPAIHAFAGTFCALAIAGYCATRLVAFPLLADDLGNWLEPLGVVSVASELAAVGAATAALRGAAGRGRGAAG